MNTFRSIHHLEVTLTDRDASFHSQRHIPRLGHPCSANMSDLSTKDVTINFVSKASCGHVNKIQNYICKGVYSNVMSVLLMNQS